MQYEVEQKFRIIDMTALEYRLGQLSAVEHQAIVQVDRYFQHPARNFAETDEALRIRSIGDQNMITYKGPKIDTTTKTRRELELPLGLGNSTLEQFTELLEALGFRQVREVRKSRRPFELRWEQMTVEGAIDNVDGLGAFVELELAADEKSLDMARNALASLAEQLELKDSERRGYVDLLLAKEDGR